jgi:hypothetical protein
LITLAVYKLKRSDRKESAPMNAQFPFTAIALSQLEILTRIAGISVVGFGVGLALSACGAQRVIRHHPKDCPGPVATSTARS